MQKMTPAPSLIIFSIDFFSRITQNIISKIKITLTQKLNTTNSIKMFTYKLYIYRKQRWVIGPIMMTNTITITIIDLFFSLITITF